MTNQFAAKVTPIPQPELLINNRDEVIAQRFEVADLVARQLGDGWQENLASFIEEEAAPQVLDTSHPDARESDAATRFGVLVLGGEALLKGFPGLRNLYQGPFQDCMQAALPKPVASGHLGVYSKPSAMIEAYAQTDRKIGDDTVQQRMDAHVDGRYTSLLVVKAPQTGGRLVVANNPQASSTEQIDLDATHITHYAGTLLCFSMGRWLPHYPEALRPDTGGRIVVSLNYPPSDVTDEEARRLEDFTLDVQSTG